MSRPPVSPDDTPRRVRGGGREGLHLKCADSRPAGLSTDFRKHLKRPSWGHWLQFTREGLKWLMRAEAPAPLARQLVGFYFDRPPRESKVAEALGRLLTARNDLKHWRTSAHYTPQFEALFEETDAELLRVIEGLRFLAGYGLTSVRKIDVWKRRRHNPDYEHTVAQIIPRMDFRSSTKSLATPLESEAVVLRCGEGGAYLNLDPLLVYENVSGRRRISFSIMAWTAPALWSMWPAEQKTR